MILYYEGVDITSRVGILGCVHREHAGGRCDCLEIEMNHSADWFAWEPKPDDRLQVLQDGYDTGVMYLRSVLPVDGHYRLYATSLPGSALEAGYESWENVTLRDLMNGCAAQCGLTAELYGLEGGITYPYITRDNESRAAFLDRLLHQEGGTLKTAFGKFAGIGIAYAQDRIAAQTVYLEARQGGFTYLNQPAERLRALSVCTPWGTGTARDAGAAGERTRRVANLPASDTAEAARWARGLLLNENRQAEKIILRTEFNPGWAAMERVDIDGPTAASGEWVIDQVEHDMFGGTSEATMLRCVKTVS